MSLCSYWNGWNSKRTTSVIVVRKHKELPAESFLQKASSNLQPDSLTNRGPFRGAKCRHVLPSNGGEKGLLVQHWAFATK